MAVRRDDILDILRTISDPEMPISIVDLGIVEEVRIQRSRDRDGAVDVVVLVLPTFIGCPALNVIRDEIVEEVGALEDVARVHVEFINDPPWSVDRISEAGRASLRAHGVTAPGIGSSGIVSATLTVNRVLAVACPFCGSTQTHVDSPFGPTRCRAIYYCDACRNTFEHMKRV